MKTFKAYLNEQTQLDEANEITLYSVIRKDNTFKKAKDYMEKEGWNINKITLAKLLNDADPVKGKNLVQKYLNESKDNLLTPAEIKKLKNHYDGNPGLRSISQSIKDFEADHKAFVKLKGNVDKSVKDNMTKTSLSLRKMGIEDGALTEAEVNEALPKGFIAYNTMIVVAQALRKGAGELDKHVEKSVIRRFELDNSVSVSKLQGIEIEGYNFGLRDIEVAIKYAMFKLDSGETETIKNITYQIPMI